MTPNCKNNARNVFYIPKNPILEVLHIILEYVAQRYFFAAAILNFRNFPELPKVATWATKLNLF